MSRATPVRNLIFAFILLSSFETESVTSTAQAGVRHDAKPNQIKSYLPPT